MNDANWIKIFNFNVFIVVNSIITRSNSRINYYRFAKMWKKKKNSLRARLLDKFNIHSTIFLCEIHWSLREGFVRKWKSFWKKKKKRKLDKFNIHWRGSLLILKPVFKGFSFIHRKWNAFYELNKNYGSRLIRQSHFQKLKS